MKPTGIALAAALILSAACAPVGEPRPAPAAGQRSAAAPHGKLPLWRIDDLAQAADPVILLRSPSGATLPFQTARAQLLQGIAARLAAAGGGPAPDLLLVGTPAINAYASYRAAQPVIGITLGMANLLQDDADAWGALIGHELAHFRLGHHQAQRARTEAVDFGSSLAGLALSAVGLGLGNIVADAAGTLVERSFSRDDERDADRAGLDYARRAGLDARGALRLQQLLRSTQRDASFSFLSTHPSGQERIDSIRQLLEQPASSAPALQAPAAPRNTP